MSHICILYVCGCIYIELYTKIFSKSGKGSLKISVSLSLVVKKGEGEI